MCNHINQTPPLPHLPEKPPTLRPPYAPRPLAPDPKGLLDPRAETHLLDHRRRDNLLAREGPPCHGVHGLAGLAGLEGTGGGAHVPGDFGGDGGGSKVGLEAVEVSEGEEKFDKGFLEDEAAGGAPAVDVVRGGKAVDGGLGGNGPVGFISR